MTRRAIHVRLNLCPAMHLLAIFLFVFLASNALPVSPAALVESPGIFSPSPGQALQGVVTISGSTNLQGFLSADLSYASAAGDQSEWFMISTLSQPVASGPLALWDTSLLPDGNYLLRLRVLLADGTSREALAAGLRVRNTTPVETDTPAPLILATTPYLETLTPEIAFPTPTLLPPNPVVVSIARLTSSLLVGGGVAVLVFLLAGLFAWMNRR